MAGLLVFTLQPSAVLAADSPGAAQFHKDIEPILTEYCYDCHADGANKGGVSFDTLKTDSDILDNHDLWWNALNYVRAGLMPPGKKAHPSAAEQQQLADWIKASVFKYDPKNPDPGRVTLRRLNRVEYRNTIHDLMGIDYDTDTEFPADDTGYGFDDIGDVLTVSPMLLEKYMTAAKDIVTQAVPTDEKTIPETNLPGSRFRPVADVAGGPGGGNDGQRRPGQGQGPGRGAGRVPRCRSLTANRRWSAPPSMPPTTAAINWRCNWRSRAPLISIRANAMSSSSWMTRSW